LFSFILSRFQNYALETLITDSADLTKLTLASLNQSESLSSSLLFSPSSLSYSRYVSPQSSQNESGFLLGKSLLHALDDDNYLMKQNTSVATTNSCVFDDSFGCTAQIEKFIDNDMDFLQMQALSNYAMRCLELKSNNRSTGQLHCSTPNTTNHANNNGCYASRRRNINWSCKSPFSSNKSTQLKLRIYNKRNRWQSKKSPQKSKPIYSSITTQNSTETVNLELLKV
jgi:hypothetical protein